MTAPEPTKYVTTEDALTILVARMRETQQAQEKLAAEIGERGVSKFCAGVAHGFEQCAALVELTLTVLKQSGAA